MTSKNIFVLPNVFKLVEKIQKFEQIDVDFVTNIT